MNQDEKAARIAAWGWAASILGVEAGPDRILGLVEVTSGVKLDRLKPALEAVIKTEPQGFLPSPGAVIAAATRLAERDHSGQERFLSAGRELGRDDHRKWMREHNPEDWDTATWQAFVERMGTDALYEKRVKHALAQRHAWAADQVLKEIGGRRVDAGYRIDCRRWFNAQALDHFPRPHPTADGWVPSKHFNPLAGLTKRMSA